MCIIIAKPADVKFPDIDTLRTCYANNPDGAGFMLASAGTVYGYKGFMTFDALLSALNVAEKRFGNLEQLPVVVHCRIGTHGGNNPGNTHPFPIASNYRAMRRTEWHASQGVAHNGIIRCTEYDPDISRRGVSDTMAFIRRYAAPIARYADIATDDKIADMLYSIADSKLTFLDGRGNLSTRGKFIEHGGVLFSNDSYMPYKPRYNWWDWIDLSHKTTGKSEPLIRLHKNDMLELADELAEQYGATHLPVGTTIKIKRQSIVCDDNPPRYLDYEGNILVWDSDYFDFDLRYGSDEYDRIEFQNDETKQITMEAIGVY